MFLKRLASSRYKYLVSAVGFQLRQGSSSGSIWRPRQPSLAKPSLVVIMASEQIKAQIMSNPALHVLGELFSRNNHEIRLAGGAVRDLMRGLSPKDLDLATTATPQQSLELLQGAEIRVVETGLQHGTVTAVIDGEPFEITTLRIDTASDGRRAKVEFTNDWERDAERRDLTVNAMFMDLSGRIYDYFNGAQHLAEHRIEFVGDPNHRIQEDYLRILRYFRFHGRIASNNTHLDNQLAAIQAHAPGLESVSGERIWMELSKILQTMRCAQLVATMKQCQILPHIGLEHVTDGHLSELDRVRRDSANPATLLTTLLDSQEQLDKLYKYWRFSIQDRKLATFLLAHRHDMLTKEGLEDLLVDKAAPSHVLELCYYQNEVGLAAHVSQFPVPTFPVNGKDLKDKGVPQGPVMGSVIQELRTQWKQSRFQLQKDDLLDQVPGLLHRDT
eukprot:m.117993 g.117993  ORF g.117993 m.117993 type:complete len:444 (-) comp15557_c0_seq2:1148-2479(-)